MATDYSYRIFPLATDLFTGYHRNVTIVSGNNIIPVAPTSQEPYATGLSVALKDVEDQVLADSHGAGYVYTGRFLGATFNDSPIEIGDILENQVDKDKFGQSIKYVVDGLSRNLLSSRLHLALIEIGV